MAEFNLPYPVWCRSEIGVALRAEMKHRGLDISLLITPAGPGHCPCQPGPCQEPGIPVATVYATSSLPMLTPVAGAHCDLTTVELDIHARVLAQDWEPGSKVNVIAVELAAAAADSGRQALSELAAHAARLGIRPNTTQEAANA